MTSIMRGLLGGVYCILIFWAHIKFFMPEILNDFFLRYAKIHIPIIASVSEHQPTTWVSFFFDLHILICTFPAGVWFVVKRINDERVFGEKGCFFLGKGGLLYEKDRCLLEIFRKNVSPVPFCGHC